MTTVLLTDADVATLNAARTILATVYDRATSESWAARTERSDAFSLGYFRAHAEAAADAIFQTLNVGRAHLGMPLTDAQVHNQDEQVTA